MGARARVARPTARTRDPASDTAARAREQVMNSIGRNPTEVELAEIVTQMDTDGNGTLDVNEFMSLMARKFKEADTMEEVLESFKARARSTRRAPARTPLLPIRNLPRAAPLRDLTPPRAGL